MIQTPKNFDEKVAIFSEILAKFNAVHSLSNYTDIKFWAKDSIAGLEYISPNPQIAIDIGSGAGVPAIFCALVLGDCAWHLFEPSPKKSAFLSMAKLELGLKNITIHRDKIENCEKFRADLITSRALGKVEFLREISSGFWDNKTQFLLYKGSEAEAEIKGLNAKIYKGEKNRNYVVFGGEI